MSVETVLSFLAGLGLGVAAAAAVHFSSEGRARRLSDLNTRLDKDLSRLMERNASLERELALERSTREKLAGEFRVAAFDAAKEFRDASLRELHQVKEEAAHGVEKERMEITASVADMKKRLEEYAEKVRRFEDERSGLYGELKKAMGDVLDAGQAIRMEAGALKRALTSGSGVRGVWGQMVLQELLEQNGLVLGQHFDTQVSLPREGESDLRPDFVVYLPGHRRLVIDAKEVAGEYLLAQETEDPARQREHYERLVQNIRTNCQKLSKKEYQQLLDPDVPFVVMFIPNEAAFRAALVTDPSLFREAHERRVVLASPMNMVPLIHLIRQAWQQQRVAENAQELGSVVEELGSRLAKFVEHVRKMRDGIQRTADAWNGALASWESRVAPQLEKARGLGGKLKDVEELPPLNAALRAEPEKSGPRTLEAPSER